MSMYTYCFPCHGNAVNTAWVSTESNVLSSLVVYDFCDGNCLYIFDSKQIGF